MTMIKNTTKTTVNAITENKKENNMNTTTKNMTVITIEGNSNCLRAIKRDGDILIDSRKLIVKGDIFDDTTFEQMLENRGVTIKEVWFEYDTKELEVIVDKDYYTLIAYNGMPDPVEYMLEDEHGFITPMSRPAAYERHRLEKFAEIIGTGTIIAPIYDEQPDWLFKIGDFCVYYAQSNPAIWYIAPKEWEYTEEEDNPWERLNPEDTVKLYPYCLEEGCWPSIYTEYDEDGEEYDSIRLGDWFVYEEEDGKIALLQY